jgi:N-acyl-D-amino-acid deacylase
MDDLVIRGGGILDGSGTDAVQGDLAIRDGRIVALTPRYAGSARREIDARGSIVGRCC